MSARLGIRYFLQLSYHPRRIPRAALNEGNSFFFSVTEMERYEEKCIARYAKAGKATLQNLQDLHLNSVLEDIA